MSSFSARRSLQARDLLGHSPALLPQRSRVFEAPPGGLGDLNGTVPIEQQIALALSPLEPALLFEFAGQLGVKLQEVSHVFRGVPTFPLAKRAMGPVGEAVALRKTHTPELLHERAE